MAGGRVALRSHLLATAAYALGCVTGVIVLVLERRDDYVRFHALQSIACSIGFAVVALIEFLIHLNGH